MFHNILRQALLDTVPIEVVGEVWGVGPRISKQLVEGGVLRLVACSS